MKKGLLVALCAVSVIILVLSITPVSAFSFSGMWGKIVGFFTGKKSVQMSPDENFTSPDVEGNVTPPVVEGNVTPPVVDNGSSPAGNITPCVSSWSPDASTMCSNTTFMQSDGCGNTRMVYGTKMIVSGGWSAWGECINSQQSRTCTNPAPQCGGAVCVGESTQVCAQNVTQNATQNVTTCTDSDGGDNIYVAGAAKVGSRAQTDCCSLGAGLGCSANGNETWVIEGMCSNNEPGGYWQQCPSLCKDGACVAVCTDSDGGKNYAVKGTTVQGNIKAVDYCGGATGNTLYEHYCDANGNLFQNFNYACPSGSLCKDGACVKNVVTVKEQVKCVFANGTLRQNCTGTASGIASKCSGAGSCVVNVNGTKGTRMTWKSSCGGNTTTTIDGVNEYAIFNCKPCTPTTTLRRGTKTPLCLAGETVAPVAGCTSMNPYKSYPSGMCTSGGACYVVGCSFTVNCVKKC